jgi:hypothetical protein
LARYLAQHSVTLAIHAGLDRASNGELIHALEELKFDVLVTSDKNIKHQQNLRARNLAIVVLPWGRWPQIEPRVHEIVKAIEGARPGTYTELPRSRNFPHAER